MREVFVVAIIFVGWMCFIAAVIKVFDLSKDMSDMKNRDIQIRKCISSEYKGIFEENKKLIEKTGRLKHEILVLQTENEIVRGMLDEISKRNS